MSSLELEIVNIFENKLLSIRLASEGDLYDECGRDKLLKQVQGFIQEKRPIQLLLPAFPCKSPNLEKVCGKLPDAGEIYALEYLNEICEEISSLYEYGCELMIWSDGRVFEDLIDVSNEDMDNYEHLLKYYSSKMSHIQWDSMNNYVNSKNGENLVKKYGTATFSFEEWLLKSESNREQFIHMRQFMETDLRKTISNKNLSRRQLKNKMGVIAEQMITRNEALANILKKYYSNHIRLSIHQHVNNGEKFTIKFFKNNSGELNSQSFLRTPWHNVLVIDMDGNFNLMPYKKLNLQNEHIPIMFKNQIWCFVQLPKNLPNSTLKLSLIGDTHRVGISIDLNKAVDIYQLDVIWMKMLLEKFNMVILRQCPNSLDKNEYLQFCQQFGIIVIQNSNSLLAFQPVSKSENKHVSYQLLFLQFDTSEELEQILWKVQMF